MPHSGHISDEFETTAAPTGAKGVESPTAIADSFFGARCVGVQNMGARITVLGLNLFGIVQEMLREGCSGFERACAQRALDEQTYLHGSALLMSTKARNPAQRQGICTFQIEGSGGHGSSAPGLMLLREKSLQTHDNGCITQRL